MKRSVTGSVASTVRARKKFGRTASWLLSIASTPGVLLVQEIVPIDLKFPVRFVLLFLLVGVIAILIVQAWRNEIALEKEKAALEESARSRVYSAYTLVHLVRVENQKTDLMRDISYDLMLSEGQWPFFYNVHQYLRDVCNELGSLVCDVSDVDLCSIDVSLIYRYEGESDWKRIVGKSGTSNPDELNDFVRDRDTLYYYLLSNSENSPIFCNEKAASHHYKPGSRDRLFDCRGSYFAAKLTYKNNDRLLVESVLMISTYGVNFVPVEMGKEAVSAFHVTLCNEVIPPFASIIEAGLANLYARHNLDKVKKLVTAQAGS